MPSQQDRSQIEEFLRSRGADRLAHPGGTLFEHLRRTSGLLGEWHADPELQLAGLCHAAYGTDGFAAALLELNERAVLRALIGERAERHVYMYASCDRAAVYPQLGHDGPIAFRDRFTHQTHQPDEADLRAFVELTAANELDALSHNPALAATHGPNLQRLLHGARHRLSDAAWHRWCEADVTRRKTTNRE